MQRAMQMFVARSASRNLSIHGFMKPLCRSRFKQYRLPERNAEVSPLPLVGRNDTVWGGLVLHHTILGFALSKRGRSEIRFSPFCSEIV